MQSLDNLYLIFQFIKRLTTPFDKTPAFKRGIIDSKGNVLRPRHTLKVQSDKDAWSWMDILINNLKRLLVKLPHGQQELFSYAMALFLLKQPLSKLHEASHYNESYLSEVILGPQSDKYMSEAIHLVETPSALLTEHGVGHMDKTDFPVATFAGCRVFEVDSDTFKKCRLGKRRYARYEQYVGNDEIGQAIREYGRTRHSKKGIILVDNITGAMLYLKYPNTYRISF